MSLSGPLHAFLRYRWGRSSSEVAVGKSANEAGLVEVKLHQFTFMRVDAASHTAQDRRG